MATEIVSTTTHKYKWRVQEVVTIAFFFTVVIALWFFAEKPLFFSVGVISFLIAAALIYLGFSRKKKSALKAYVYADGTVSVSGYNYDELKNRVKLSKVNSIKLVQHTYHPTLQLSSGSGNGLKLPRRIAEEEPLNTYIRENLSKKVYVAPEAKSVLHDILEENGNEDNYVALVEEPVIETVEKPMAKPAVKKATKIVHNSEDTETLPDTVRLIQNDVSSANISSVPVWSDASSTTTPSETLVVEEVKVVEPVKPSVKRVQPKRKPKSKR